MTKFLLRAALAAGLLTGFHAPAQQTRTAWCATDANTQLLEATFRPSPALLAERAAADRLAIDLQEGRQTLPRPTASRVLPLVVHVVTRCGNQTITKAQIDAGVAQLNADWNRLNADTVNTIPIFKQRATALDVEFRLARLDPQGQPTDGVHRVSSPATTAVNPRDLLKSLVPYWPNYFNVWLVDEIAVGAGTPPGNIVLGYAQFPGTGSWGTWGVVMRFDDWTGSIGNGRTMAHEVGHCFNLYHTFQGGCGSNCTSTGDQVCDTPPQATATNANCTSALTANTCRNDNPDLPDPTQNFMSYDDCQNYFSQGQKARVDAALASFSYIQNMLSPANQLATGIATGQTVAAPAPVPYFGNCIARVCQGGTLSFSDGSYGAPVTSRLWSFTGAALATDTARTTIVTFTTPGTQTVSLQVQGGPGTTAQPAYTLQVEVLPQGTLTAPVVESFEGAGFPVGTAYRVTTNSLTTNLRTWETLTPTPPGAPTDGQTLLRVPNNAMAGGTVATLETPTLDTRLLASSPPPVLSFDVAYAKRNTASADKLAVSYSTNCGQSWVPAGYIRTGTSLATVTGNMSSGFVPQAGQWRSEQLARAAFANQPSLIFKFESTTSETFGSAIFLDNLRFNGQTVTGLAAPLAATGALLAPNPLTGETTLTLPLAQSARVALTVRDLLGRPVLTDGPQLLAAGEHRLPLGRRLQGAAAGVYVVTVTVGTRSFTQKLLVQP